MKVIRASKHRQTSLTGLLLLLYGTPSYLGTAMRSLSPAVYWKSAVVSAAASLVTYTAVTPGPVLTLVCNIGWS